MAHTRMADRQRGEETHISNMSAFLVRVFNLFFTPIVYLHCSNVLAEQERDTVVLENNFLVPLYHVVCATN